MADGRDDAADQLKQWKSQRGSQVPAGPPRFPRASHSEGSGEPRRRRARSPAGFRGTRALRAPGRPQISGGGRGALSPSRPRPHGLELCPGTPRHGGMEAASWPGATRALSAAWPRLLLLGSSGAALRPSRGPRAGMDGGGLFPS